MNKQERKNKTEAGDDNEEEEWLKDKDNDKVGWRVQQQERRLHAKKGGYDLLQTYIRTIC